jgi:hypothetical protein
MRLNNAGAARKANGYTEQARYQPRVVDFTVLVSAAYQRRPDPATHSSRLPQIMRGPITTAVRRHSHGRTNSFTTIPLW